MIKIRRSHDRLIFIMETHELVSQHLYSKMGPMDWRGTEHLRHHFQWRDCALIKYFGICRTRRPSIIFNGQSIHRSKHLRQKYFVRSIPWMLMPWLLAFPRYQQPWHCMRRIQGPLFSIRMDFKYLRHTWMPINDRKCQYIFVCFPPNKWEQ